MLQTREKSVQRETHHRSPISEERPSRHSQGHPMFQRHIYRNSRVVQLAPTRPQTERLDITVTGESVPRVVAGVRSRLRFRIHNIKYAKDSKPKCPTTEGSEIQSRTTILLMSGVYNSHSVGKEPASHYHCIQTCSRQTKSQATNKHSRCQTQAVLYNALFIGRNYQSELFHSLQWRGTLTTNKVTGFTQTQPLPNTSSAHNALFIGLAWHAHDKQSHRLHTNTAAAKHKQCSTTLSSLGVIINPNCSTHYSGVARSRQTKSQASHKHSRCQTQAVLYNALFIGRNYQSELFHSLQWVARSRQTQSQASHKHSRCQTQAVLTTLSSLGVIINPNCSTHYSGVARSTNKVTGFTQTQPLPNTSSAHNALFIGRNYQSELFHSLQWRGTLTTNKVTGFTQTQPLPNKAVLYNALFIGLAWHAHDKQSHRLHTNTAAAKHKQCSTTLSSLGVIINPNCSTHYSGVARSRQTKSQASHKHSRCQTQAVLTTLSSLGVIINPNCSTHYSGVARSRQTKSQASHKHSRCQTQAVLYNALFIGLAWHAHDKQSHRLHTNTAAAKHKQCSTTLSSLGWRGTLTTNKVTGFTQTQPLPNTSSALNALFIGLAWHAHDKHSHRLHTNTAAAKHKQCSTTLSSLGVIINPNCSTHYSGVALTTNTVTGFTQTQPLPNTAVLYNALFIGRNYQSNCSTHYSGVARSRQTQSQASHKHSRCQTQAVLYNALFIGRNYQSELFHSLQWRGTLTTNKATDFTQTQPLPNTSSALQRSLHWA
ncbi:hypothetical protein J6590_052005 [Homalodisca vitripennis]|nr:hypothetical protein J6590_052005 [Homalodisca vitripennis]